MTFGSATNRTSVGMVAELFSQVCAGEGATTRDKGYRYRSTHAGTLIKIFPDGANWASTSVARTSEQREE